MEYIFKFLESIGYSVSNSYYSYIENWISIWKGKQKWLKVQTIDDGEFPMYTLDMAKKSCEDLASTITSEPFTIKAKSNDEILQEDLKKAKVLKKLPEALEIMAYTGTMAMVSRIVKANIVGEGEDAYLQKGENTRIKTILLKGNQIIPLTIEDGDIINVAFVSEDTRVIEGKKVKIACVEVHELEDKGYQITNKYFREDTGEEVVFDGVLETYNTLSSTPLFSIQRLPIVNKIDDSNGLGMALFADAIDQLKILDLTYNNFGQDFRLGQKVMIINKKLTKIESVPEKQEDGTIKQVTKVKYPTDIQKQLFTDISQGIMNNPNETPYIYEYNPDLRVGDNKEGVQFALDTFAFKIGYGTHFYSFDRGGVVTATETMVSRKDFVDSMTKIRNSTNEFLENVCRSMLVCEKMLGNNVDETQDIDIPQVDGFLQDDETQREKMFTDAEAGFISHRRYLKKVYGLNDKEIDKEFEDIKNEQDSEPIETEIDDVQEGE